MKQGLITNALYGASLVGNAQTAPPQHFSEFINVVQIFNTHNIHTCKVYIKLKFLIFFFFCTTERTIIIIFNTAFHETINTILTALSNTALPSPPHQYPLFRVIVGWLSYPCWSL